ncbi:BTAD domain-containing putative transcriptional regulator [Streptomyces sp. NPDC005840]|uniref:ATP-binding protein n=1 Tax=Streptomyces sp. NPDC005840 TaxID=3157072 RepID=UPI00340D0EA3
MRYRILGVTQADDENGVPVPLPGPRLRTLLTALALAPGRPLPPSALIPEIWPDEPPRDAPAALQALVARLRRALGRAAVTSTAAGYRLTATEDDIDLFVFARLVGEAGQALADDPGAAARTLDEALALWRGPALADLPDRTAAASRPEALRLEATRARADADLRLGRAADALPRLRELTGAHPYDEPLHALLIRALRDSGRPAEALAAYERTRRTLSEDLGTVPGPELTALHRDLLAPQGADPRPGPAHPGPSARPRPAPRPAPTGNLRPRLDSFVGREPEIAAIRSELHRVRLITLTGPGGSGKTRLAEEAAAGLPQAWLVELAPLDQPEAVPDAVVTALGLRETVLKTTEQAAPQDDPLTLLVEHCAPHAQLLILDNCEHVIEAAATLAEELLTRCPRLTILATSREPLGVPGEAVRPVEPLVPDQAHRLFTERATTARPDVATAVFRDREAVAEICRRLDGLPLAIELAAARLRMLTPRQIADRLDDRFRLLTSGSRTALPRQQTLRAVVDWSWDLLDERERTVLREVSVFAGGWDLSAAEAVCTGPAPELIGALVDKSLVVAAPHPAPDRTGRNGGDEDGDGDGDGGNRNGDGGDGGSRNGGDGDGGHGGPVRDSRDGRDGRDSRDAGDAGAVDAPGADGMRYRLLETIHEYAVERAAETPALRSAAERRHLAWARSLVARAEPRLRSADQLPWIARLETELDNIRAALTRSLAAGAEEEAGALALGMGWFWWLRNYRLEGISWTSRVLALGASLDAGAAPPAASPDPVDAFLGAPDGESGHPRHLLRMDLRMLHLFLRSETEPLEGLYDDERLRSYVVRVRDHFRGGGPRSARMPGLLWPLTAFVLGSPRDALLSLDATVANCRRHGDDWAVGVILMFRTHLAVDSPGALTGVDADLAELRLLSARVGDRWMRAQVCGAAGEAAMVRGATAQAGREYEEALRLAYEVGAFAETPYLLARLAEIAYRAGDRPKTLRLLDEAAAAADAYLVADSRAFVLLTRARLALDDGDVHRARAMVTAAREAIGKGTPPPQFTVMLRLVEALVTVAESGPASGLPLLADTVGESVARRCADVVTASVVDAVVVQLVALGRDFERAARLLGAADHRRRGTPRPLPEGAEAERAEAAIRAALGEARLLAEHGAGAALGQDALLAELAPLRTEFGPGKASGPRSR